MTADAHGAFDARSVFSLGSLFLGSVAFSAAAGGDRGAVGAEPVPRTRAEQQVTVLKTFPASARASQAGKVTVWESFGGTLPASAESACNSSRLGLYFSI